MGTILITGHKGYIGKNLIHQFKKNKISYTTNINTKKKISDVIHLAFKKNILNKNFLDNFSLNIEYLQKIINFCKKKNARLIFTSSCMYKSSLKSHKETNSLFAYDYYSLSKIICENIIKAEIKKHVILRIFNLYGYENFSIIYKIKTKKNIKIVGDPNIERDFVHISDLFNLIFKILKTNKNGVFNVGSGKSFKLKNLLKINKVRLKTKTKNFLFSRKKVRANLFKTKKTFHWQPNIDLVRYINEKKNYSI